MKSLAVVALLLVGSPAVAGRDKDDSGPGRLGQVTSGIDRATNDAPRSSSSSSSGSSSSSNDHDYADDSSSCCTTYSSSRSSG
ncbi:MAG: hypothetical protein WKG01_26030, partial [Kofleriaceae bacterium]